MPGLHKNMVAIEIPNVSALSPSSVEFKNRILADQVRCFQVSLSREGVSNKTTKVNIAIRVRCKKSWENWNLCKNLYTKDIILWKIKLVGGPWSKVLAYRGSLFFSACFKQRSHLIRCERRRWYRTPKPKLEVPVSLPLQAGCKTSKTAMKGGWHPRLVDHFWNSKSVSKRPQLGTNKNISNQTPFFFYPTNANWQLDQTKRSLHICRIEKRKEFD